ncbi:SulP family inorganic anion transporter [Reyranella aquatilis]|uniref:SulP family inorganic anion transporter n=1 Tax=Reyranella aquatilis TaxID=2035356 RepID=A0ABS8L2S5_9HYPH|nr:SulP family inorganic anion transporter [Reyranella aquatilis]MCC8432654.1 SulP family inorganic anion transporter [Reyranella aquatilis]
MKIVRWMPGLAAVRDYRASFLPRDLAAGVTLGAVMVPVGLAYGELAGLPLAGLYGSMLPLLAYALFGSSRHLVVGPDTAMAAIVAVAVAPLAIGDPTRLAFLAAGLGVMVGAICLLAGLFRLGFVANFLSKPVITGFLHGLALVILGAQLPKVLGLRVDGAMTLDQFAATIRQLGETNLASLAIGASCLAVILLCRRFAPRVPGAVLALAGSMLAVVLLGLDRQGVTLVGRIPTGLPDLSLPLLSLADFDVLLPVALVAALLSFSDTMITARAFGTRHGTRVDADQELLGLGAANLVSGLSQGLPISASDTRTAVAEAAGSRTQLTMVIAAAIVAGVTLWLADLLYHLPTAALGGILIASAWGLCDVDEFRRLWRFRRSDFAAALLTMAGVAALGVMEGILVGVVFSLVLLLRALAFPSDAVLGRTPDGGWHDVAHRPDATPVPGLLVYRFSAPLFFANCELFRDRIEARIAAAAHPVRRVVVDGGAIHDIDLMACELLVELERELRAKGISVAFGNLRDRVRRDIERGLHLTAGDGEGDLVFPSVAAAAAALDDPGP